MAQTTTPTDQLPKSQAQTSNAEINLEKVLLIEDKLWTLLEVHRFLERVSIESNTQHREEEKEQESLQEALTNEEFASKLSEVAFLCDEWWEITHQDSFNNLEKAFHHDKLRRAVRQGQISILLTVTTCYAYSIEKCDCPASQEPISAITLQKAKKVLFYAHQTLLILIELIVHKLPAVCSHNLWAHSLQAILLNKRVQESTHYGGHAASVNLESHSSSFILQKKAKLSRSPLDKDQKAIDLQALTQSTVKLLRSISKDSESNAHFRTELNKPVFKCVQNFAKAIDRYSLQQVRQLLFNLLETLTLQKQKQHSETEESASHLNQKTNIIEATQEESKAPSAPYLPAPKVPHEFTLVLDLDETLIHFIEMPPQRQSNTAESIQQDDQNDSQLGGHFLIRPGAQEFLQKMSEAYELVIFTAAMQDYADWVLDQLDTDNLISFRLYRHHTLKQNHVYQKDLSLLGRDLAKTIIVDNVASNFQNQPQNGIEIRSWYDDPQDVALYELAPILLQIVGHPSGDLRTALASYGDSY